MNIDLRKFLISIDGSKSTPLKQVVDKHLARHNLRISALEEAIGISNSQTKRILNGTTGTSDRVAEQLRQFLDMSDEHWNYLFDSHTRQAKTHTELVEQRKTFLGAVDVSGDTANHGLQKPSVTGKTMALATALLAGGAVTVIAVDKPETPPPLASVPPDRPCTIDLRKKIPEKISCDEFGTFVVTGDSLSNWNQKASIVRVNRGWDVISRHETWGEPNYSVLENDKSGFVHLPIGDNFLSRQDYSVYESVGLQNEPRQSIERELNDKLQYLVVRGVGAEPIVIWEHDHLEDPNRLTITHAQ